MQEILISQMYSGSYIKDEIGYEVINLIKSDNGKQYLFVNPYGIVGKRHKYSDIASILLVRAVNKNTAQILANVYVQTQNTILKESLENEDMCLQKKFIKDAEIKYAGFFLDEIFSEENKKHFVAHITYEVSKMYFPKNKLFLTVDQTLEDDKENSYIHISGKRAVPQSCHRFFNENEMDFSTIKNVLQDLNRWEIFNAEPIDLMADEQYGFINIIKKQYDELAYSNVLSFLFGRDSNIFIKFAKEILNLNISENYRIHREFQHIDLFIEDEHNIVVIENKIKSKINGQKITNDGTIETQLATYKKYADGVAKGKKVSCFLFSPDYNNLDLRKYGENLNYTQIKYSTLYNFYKENPIHHRDFEECLHALKVHASNFSNMNAEVMKYGFSLKIRDLKYGR